MKHAYTFFTRSLLFFGLLLISATTVASSQRVTFQLEYQLSNLPENATIKIACSIRRGGAKQSRNSLHNVPAAHGQGTRARASITVNAAASKSFRKGDDYECWLIVNGLFGNNLKSRLGAPSSRQIMAVREKK